MTQDKTHKVPNVPPLRFPEFTGEWEKCKLENIIHVQGGYAFQSEKFQTIGVPIIRISNLPQDSNTIDLTECVYYENGNYDNFIVQKGDLLIAMSGATTGKTAIYKGDEKAFCNQRVGLFRLKDKKLYYKFLYPFVESESFANQLNSKLVAGAQPNISSKDIEDISISLPQIIEQQKLSRLLELITQRIATQNKIIQHLESLIKGISQYLFGMVSSKFIPLSQLCNIQKGQQVNSEELTESGKYYMMNGGIIPSGYYDKYNTESNTISISEGGNSCGYVQYNDCRFWSGGHCYTITDIKSNISTLYLFHYLKFKEQDIMALRIGSGLPNIQKKDIAKFPVLVLPEKQQEQITNLLQSITTKIKVEKDCLANLSQQKQYLLQQMFI